MVVPSLLTPPPHPVVQPNIKTYNTRLRRRPGKSFTSALITTGHTTQMYSAVQLYSTVHLHCTVLYSCTVHHSSQCCTAVQYITAHCTVQLPSSLLYCTLLYNTVLYGTVLWRTVRLCTCTVQYSTVKYCTIQLMRYSTVQHCTVKYCTIQLYNEVQYWQHSEKVLSLI